MALLDKVPGDDRLYIGGIFTLRRKEALNEAGITHVLSVLRLPLEKDLFSAYEHMTIEVDDVEDENLLQYFPQTNAFIQSGLDSGGGVLVHCAMGKSRSATCVMAYLMQKFHINPQEALAHVRQGRPLCEPNEGFMEQLELYHKMQTPKTLDEDPAYQRWLYRREVELSRACGQAPEADKIRFEDEHNRGDKSESAFELRCRKCRRQLATSTFLTEHHSQQILNDQSMEVLDSPAPPCAHYFVDPLSWMRPELEQGKLEGRLECPKCRTNVGKYAWQGMQCSCGEWVVPGISLAKSRIDEAKPRNSSSAAAIGIRKPPGSAPTPPTAGISQGNL